MLNQIWLKTSEHVNVWTCERVNESRSSVPSTSEHVNMWTCVVWTCERVNWWTSEWVNGWTSEHLNEWTGELVNKQTIERLNVLCIGVNKGTRNEWTMSKRKNERTNERMNEWTNDRMNEWTNERMKLIFLFQVVSPTGVTRASSARWRRRWTNVHAAPSAATPAWAQRRLCWAFMSGLP